MSAAAELAVLFTADTTAVDKATSKLNSGFGKLSSFGKTAGLAVAGGAAVGAAAIAGIGTAAVMAASDFETQMKQVETLGADFGRPFKDVQADVSKLATAMGVDATDAATTLYNAVSAGVPPGNALEFMEAATKVAVGGAADLSAVGDSMSTVMNSWGDSAGDATAITDKLFQAVKDGKTNMAELASSIGGVAGIAGASNVAFEETAAAIAQITTKGKTTSMATTQLKGLIAEIVTPTSKAAQALEEFGFSSGAAAFESEGLSGVLSMLQETADSSGVGLNAMFGSVDAGAAALDLAGSNAAAFNEKLDNMDAASGNAQDALEKVNEGFQRQAGLLKSQVSGALREVGLSMLPIVTDGIGRLVESLKGDAFTGFIESVKAGVGVVGDALLPALDQIGPVLQALTAGFAAAFGDMGSDAGGMAESIAAAIENIDFEAVAEGARSFGEAIGGALSWLIDNKELVAEWALKIGALVGAFALLAPIVTTLGAVASIVGTVASAIGGLLGAVGGASAIFGALATAAGAIAAVLTGPVLVAIGLAVGGFLLWKTKGDEIKAWLAGLGAWLSAKWEEIKADTAAVLDSIATAIGDAWQEATEAISSALDAIGSAIRLAWDAALREISDKLAAILGAVTNAWSATREAVAGALDAIGGAVSQGWDAIVSVIQGAMTIAKTVIMTGWLLIKESIASAMQLIRDIISGNFDAIRETASLWISNVWAIISDGWHRIYTTVGGMLENILGAVSQIFGLIPGRIGEALQRAVTVVGDKLFAVLDAIYNFGTRALDAAHRVGQDIMQGLLDGINWGINLVQRAVEGIGSLIPQWLRDILDSRSPSRVTFAIGQDIIAGLTLGIGDGEPDLLKQIETTIKSLVSIIESGVDAILSLASLEGKSLDQGALDDVSAAVKAITDMFAAPGGVFDSFLKEEETVREALASGGKLMADMIGGLVSIVKGVAGLTSDLAGQTERAAIDAGMVRGALATLVGIFNAPGGIFDTFVQESEAMRERLASAGKQFADMMAGLVAVVKLSEVGEIEPLLVIHKHKLEAVLRFLRDELASVIEGIAAGWEWTTERAKAVQERVGAFNSTMGAIVDALKLSEIGEIEPLLSVRKHQLVAVLTFLRDEIAPAIEGIVDGWTMAAEKAKALADRLDLFNKVLSPAIALLKASEIGEIKPLVSVHAHALQAVLRFMRDEIFTVLTDIVDAWQVSAEKAADLAARITSFAGMLDAVVGALKSVQGLAALDEVKEFGAGILDGLLAQVQAFAKGIAGFALVIDQAAAEAMTKLGPAAESMMQVQTLIADIFDNPFMSSSRRLRGAQTSAQFGQLANPNTFQARVIESIKASIATLLQALDGVTIPTDLAERFNPLKEAAEALKASMDALANITLPPNLREIMGAASLLAALGVSGGGGGTGGGGGAANFSNLTVASDNVLVPNATIDMLGVSLDVNVGGERMGAVVNAAYQKDASSLDQLIKIIDQRRARTP